MTKDRRMGYHHDVLKFILHASKIAINSYESDNNVFWYICVILCLDDNPSSIDPSVHGTSGRGNLEEFTLTASVVQTSLSTCAFCDGH